MFLSHNWGTDELDRDNHQRVSIINKELKRMGYKTWFDEDRLRGDIDKQMTKGIEQTKCVIVFITQKYYDKVNGEIANDNCYLEFSHAKRIKTSNKMIAVVMEPCMTKAKEWKGEVGMHLGGKIYIDMTKNVENKTYLRKQLEKLENELLNMKVQPMKNINENITEKKRKSGIFLFLTIQYTVKGNFKIMISLRESCSYFLECFLFVCLFIQVFSTFNFFKQHLPLCYFPMVSLFILSY